MSSMGFMPAALTVALADDSECVDASLRSLAGAVQELASRIDAMWSEHSTDGSVALRLVEASHALHRAVIALQDDFLIGPSGRS